MKVFILMKLFAVGVLISIAGVSSTDVDFFEYVGASGTQLGRDKDDPNFYTTNARIPHLPRMDGFMRTEGTYRFMSIAEQTVFMIGEPKHGLWRIQESGFIREYRKAGMTGLVDGTEANDWDALNQTQKDIVTKNYASYIPEESDSGDKYQDQRLSPDGFQNFVDLTIYHPKYGGKYENHTVIDLPHFSCTMSSGNYPHADHIWKYTMAQPKANTIGPLGLRAGLDIKENYLNVLQMQLFSDAKVWVNVGIGNNITDVKIGSLADVNSRDPQTINYQILDTSRIEHEIYLIERSFFNVPYIFVTLILENNNLSDPTFAYLRPDGLYWQHLQNRNLGAKVSKKETHFLRVYVNNETDARTAYSLPVHHLHEPNGANFGMAGGVCPKRGGGAGFGNPGGWWPTALQEITPICDAFLLDVKYWANLWNTSWTDLGVGFPHRVPYSQSGASPILAVPVMTGNAGLESMLVEYIVESNVYGNYTDPYLVGKGMTNPLMLSLTSDGGPVMNFFDGGMETAIIPIEFANPGNVFDYVHVSGLKALNKSTQCGDSHMTGADFHDHVDGIELGANNYSTNSRISHLPRMDGYMGTHGTYRFMSVAEQTAWMVGQPKHGLWRGQESGFIREYRKAGMTGLADAVDANDWDALTQAQKYIVTDNYASFNPNESYAGYKYPDQRLSTNGNQNFIDLTIYHPKYGGKYENHTIIDLPQFGRAVSSGNYPHADDIWKYAMAQPKANTIGPLGLRAGLDIKENYLNVLRMHLFSDASVWVNVGVDNKITDIKIGSLADLNSRGPQTINYQILDTSRIEHEIYLFERPFFNVPHIFITLVLEHKNLSNPIFAYLRPDGLYWEHLQNRNLGAHVSNNVTHFPQVYINNEKDARTAYSLPVYGLHEPNRIKFGMNGGACPERGGDYGRYPWGNPGGGWPTMLQEISPLCDALSLDIKIWANLWNTFWTDLGVGYGNANFLVKYKAELDAYGNYTDPYLVGKGMTNPMMLSTSDGDPVTNFTFGGTESVVVPLKFSNLGTTLDYVHVPGLKALNESDQCSADSDSPVSALDNQSVASSITPSASIALSSSIESSIIPSVTSSIDLSSTMPLPSTASMFAVAASIALSSSIKASIVPSSSSINLSSAMPLLSSVSMLIVPLLSSIPSVSASIDQSSSVESSIIPSVAFSITPSMTMPLPSSASVLIASSLSSIPSVSASIALTSSVKPSSAIPSASISIVTNPSIKSSAISLIASSIAPSSSSLILPSSSLVVAASCIRETNIDYSGNDFRIFDVNNIETCDDACLQDEKCVGFAFDKNGKYGENGKYRCWLKNKLLNRQHHSDIITGHCPGPNVLIASSLSSIPSVSASIALTSSVKPSSAIPSASISIVTNPSIKSSAISLVASSIAPSSSSLILPSSSLVVAAQECYTGNGVAYRGSISITESGKLCQNWNTQTPHTHSHTPENLPNAGLVANYCRIGGMTNALRPWCLTTDEDTKWEYCNVPKCSVSASRALTSSVKSSIIPSVASSIDPSLAMPMRSSASMLIVPSLSSIPSVSASRALTSSVKSSIIPSVASSIDLSSPMPLRSSASMLIVPLPTSIPSVTASVILSSSIKSSIIPSVASSIDPSSAMPLPSSASMFIVPILTSIPSVSASIALSSSVKSSIIPSVASSIAPSSAMPLRPSASMLIVPSLSSIPSVSASVALSSSVKSSIIRSMVSSIAPSSAKPLRSSASMLVVPSLSSIPSVSASRALTSSVKPSSAIPSASISIVTNPSLSIKSSAISLIASSIAPSSSFSMLPSSSLVVPLTSSSPTVVDVKFELNGTLDEIEDLPTFKANLKQQIADGFGVNKDQILNFAVKSGSIIITFQLKQSSAVQNALETIKEKAKDGTLAFTVNGVFLSVDQNSFEVVGEHDRGLSEWARAARRKEKNPYCIRILDSEKKVEEGRKPDCKRHLAFAAMHGFPYVPSCNMTDNTFGPLQCEPTYCWCARENGDEMEDSRRPAAENGTMNCDLLRENEKMADSACLAMVKSKPRNFQPDCEDGKFKPQQCLTRPGFCWCSRRDGKAFPGTLHHTAGLNNPDCARHASLTYECPDAGMFGHPFDCHRYVKCGPGVSRDGSGGTAYACLCPADLIYNEELKVCDHPSKVKCKTP